MSSFNKVLLMGNLTRDPELKYTPKGSAVCQFGMAVNRKWKDQAGELKEEVTFVDCTAWSATAEAISKYLRKGSPIFVEGRLAQETWDDKTTGQKRRRRASSLSRSSSSAASATSQRSLNHPSRSANRLRKPRSRKMTTFHFDI